MGSMHTTGGGGFSLGLLSPDRSWVIVCGVRWF